jgi:hypothetical protein
MHRHQADLRLRSRAEPMVVRGLFEASYVFYGAMGLIVAAFMLASAGSAILATGAFPRWIGWLALGGAVVNLIAAPSIYGALTTPPSIPPAAGSRTSPS